MEPIIFLAGLVTGGLVMWFLLASKSLARRPRRFAARSATKPNPYRIRDEHLTPEQRRLKEKKFP